MINKKTILIVDDEKINLNILIGLLSDDYEVSVALNGQKALSLVEKKKIDLILLDIMMPDMDGYEVCNILQSNTQTKDIPIIFITAKTDEIAIEKAYDIGGTDYVTKPFKPKELLARIKKEIKIQELQTELKYLASTDYMTKLYNRRYFSSTAEDIFNIIKKESGKLSVIALDIDNFKKINDTHGHKTGDDILINLASRLQHNQGEEDIVSRFGGDEFVILLVNRSLEKSKAFAEKLRIDIESQYIQLDNESKLKYTVSLGVAEVEMSEEDSIETALRSADGGLIHAKKNGRNRTCSINN